MRVVLQEAGTGAHALHAPSVPNRIGTKSFVNTIPRLTKFVPSMTQPLSVLTAKQPRGGADALV